MRYILVGKSKRIKKAPDLLKWAHWMQTSPNRRVAVDRVGKVVISTVFLGLDRGWGGAAPLLFETMIFGSKNADYYQERYTTYGQALKGHKRAIKMVTRKGSDTLDEILGLD